MADNIPHMDSHSATTPVRPILRWAGGKRWLVRQLAELIGDLEFTGYREPFLGGASVFLGLGVTGQAHLSDTNGDLIETYQQVRDSPSKVARSLQNYENTSERYYDARLASPTDAIERAARFIYLNHTSFNGIYRVNLKGVYNVPYGRRKSPQIPDAAQLSAVSERLQDAHIGVTDFAECTDSVRPGELVFLDPPYTVAHNQNGFVKYNQHLFSFTDQERLSLLIDAIKEQGAYYLLTNAAHPSIAELFEKGDRRIETSRRNSIGGVSATRGSATEYLFTNVPSA